MGVEEPVENINPLSGEIRKLEKISKRSFYENIVYTLDVLVPQDDDKEIFVPSDSYLQQVHYDRLHKWRVQRNDYSKLPAYLTDHKTFNDKYEVIVEKGGFLNAIDPTSSFAQKWDVLSLSLLLYTASVTPFETAFLNESLVVDILFLINTSVDLIFFYDMFVQMRTPYKDNNTGKYVRDVKLITASYLKSWFFIDLFSVFPFEFLGAGSTTSDLSQLRILKLMRLTRLFKLLRMFRANRKLKKLQVHSGLRYETVNNILEIIVVIFLVHWFACGYRMVTQKLDPHDPDGWMESYMAAKNETSMTTSEAYFLALYWACSTVSLIGNNYSVIAPSKFSEFVYASFVSLVCILYITYTIASKSSFLNSTRGAKTSQDILIDNYLELLDSLQLDQRLKYKVYDHLTDHFTEMESARQTKLLRDLPANLHGFIALEMFLDFVEQIPYLEPFIERDPQMIQDICRLVEIKKCTANNFIFTEGYNGIYMIDTGLVVIEGTVYSSKMIFGQTILRENIKKCECRALTDVQYYALPRDGLLDVLAKYPKVKYYAKRWTAWELLREYIRAYTRLYYTAAKRGALLSPPLLSRRPNMVEGEYDDIDVAVLDHITEMGY